VEPACTGPRLGPAGTDGGFFFRQGPGGRSLSLPCLHSRVGPPRDLHPFVTRVRTQNGTVVTGPGLGRGEEGAHPESFGSAMALLGRDRARGPG